MPKVTDADGNPIEIAAVVVWQVADTAKALYAVDDYPRFVAIQTETAVRHIASSYPYTSHGGGELSLRDNADEITQQLSAEIADRVRSAGVVVVESRLTRLSYAAGIAQAMLRQQQANAVVGARQRIVEGAVGMVQLALQRLQDEGDRKSTRLNSSHSQISYAVFCLKKKKHIPTLLLCHIPLSAEAACLSMENHAAARARPDDASPDHSSGHVPAGLGGPSHVRARHH